MGAVNKFEPLKNENIKITYLNLIILIIIISAPVNALFLNVFKLSAVGYILILLPFILGGILAGLILDKNKRIVGGLLVSAMASAVSLSIYGVINQIFAGSLGVAGYALYYILMIPIFLIIGGLMGFIGSVIVLAGDKINKRVY